MNIQER